MARLWDLVGNELAVFQGQEYVINSAVFSPNGELILTTSSDDTVRLWDLLGNELVVFQEHREGILSTVFSPDGSMILTTSGDDMARLWDLTGNELAVFQGHGEDFRLVVFSPTVNTGIFSPDGKMVLTASGDYTARLWLIYSFTDMVTKAEQQLNRGFTEAECHRYFRDDLNACPRTLEELFAPFDI